MKYYPDAVLKDYKAVDTYAWLKDLNNNGSAVYEAGNVFTVGNRSDAIFYNVYPGAGFYHYGKEAVYPNVPGHNDAVYDADAYGMFLWDANRFKNLYTSSKGNLSAIVTYYDYAVTNKAPDRTDTSSNTPYYTETIYHVGLLDPDPFCCYVYPGDVGDGDTAAYNHKLSVLSEIANELTRLVGFSDRKPIPVPAAWNNGYVLSGMYANGRNVWRITPDTTDGMTLENFKTSDATPTFSINGQTITFPGGKIIKDSKISEVGTCGYWVETPKDVMPIVTNIADRYSQYPSFAEDFEQYEIGTKFDSTTALPEQCWEVTPSKGATAVIQAANGNNALALTGNVTIKNLKLPQNITAGDYYAKQQAWEVTFTMPKTLDVKSELILLNVVTAKDGGIKIADGKLWYDQAGKYQVMEGVSIAAGETYTVKRELDLTTESAYISDYAIYNVEGKKLGSAQNIPLCADFAVPVSVIGLSCANIISDPVLLDDYKLYPTGAAMDFELYDAKTGILVADPTTARNSDTAYRLSWMNATDKVKLANVVVEKYDTNNTLISKTVLQEVKMAPGCDGVETGIVKNETEGQTILVYLEAKNVASADSIGFIVITSIVLGVLSIVVAVAWVLVLKRKRNTAAQ